MFNTISPLNMRFKIALLCGAMLGVCVSPNSASAQGSAVQPARPTETIIVTGQPNRNLPPGALKDSHVRTEVFGPASIEAVHANNVNEALDRNLGIAVQIECSICSVRNVSLNSLRGRVPLLLSKSSSVDNKATTARGLVCQTLRAFLYPI